MEITSIECQFSVFVPFLDRKLDLMLILNQNRPVHYNVTYLRDALPAVKMEIDGQDIEIIIQENGCVTITCFGARTEVESFEAALLAERFISWNSRNWNKTCLVTECYRDRFLGENVPRKGNFCISDICAKGKIGSPLDLDHMVTKLNDAVLNDNHDPPCVSYHCRNLMKFIIFADGTVQVSGATSEAELMETWTKLSQRLVCINNERMPIIHELKEEYANDNIDVPSISESTNKAKQLH